MQTKGNKLMLFVDSTTDMKPVALATNHTLTVNPSILTDRTKDDGNAPVGEFEYYDWGMSADSIVGYNEGVLNEQTIVDILDLALGMSTVYAATDAALPASGGGWSFEDGDQYNTGVGIIESVSISAGSTGYATASVSVKGSGSLYTNE